MWGLLLLAVTGLSQVAAIMLLLRAFPFGYRIFAALILAIVLLLQPRQSASSLQSVCDEPCCLRPMKKGSAAGIPFRGYVCIHSLRPDDSLTILAMASSIGFQDSVSFLLTIPATGF
jgi:hypothetical protein